MTKQTLGEYFPDACRGGAAGYRGMVLRCQDMGLDEEGLAAVPSPCCFNANEFAQIRRVVLLNDGVRLSIEPGESVHRAEQIRAHMNKNSTRPQVRCSPRVPSSQCLLGASLLPTPGWPMGG